MRGDSVSSDISPPLQAVLESLDDADCRAILRETAEAKTATELIETCDITNSTVYRKLELLTKASLVRKRETVNPEGGRTTYYFRDFDDIRISMDDDDCFAVDIERPFEKQPSDS